MLAKAAFPAFFLTLAGFVLFLLVTLSVPHIKTINLLSLKDERNSQLTFGVFGACYRIARDVAQQAGVRAKDCSASGLGYSINYAPESTFDLGDPTSRRVTLVQKALSTALVVNPVAAGLAGFSLIWAFCAWFCSSRAFAIITFITLLLSALFGWIAFAVDIALAIIARNRMRDVYPVDGTIGNGVWMALGGAIALTIGICAAGCGVFGRYSSRRDKGTY